MWEKWQAVLLGGYYSTQEGQQEKERQLTERQ